jgi:hypothetical protein
MHYESSVPARKIQPLTDQCDPHNFFFKIFSSYLRFIVPKQSIPTATATNYYNYCYYYYYSCYYCNYCHYYYY